MATVISMWGAEGTGGPSCTTVMPRSQRGPTSSSALTNCDDAEASMVTVPPASAPRPRTTKGSPPRPPSSTVAPRCWRAARTGPRGRWRARGSPSKATSPSASAATGGRNRITVPALPTSTAAGPVSGPGVTVHRALPRPAIPTPSAVSPAAMSEVSRASSTFSTRAGPSASPASTRARFVIDFEPGTVTVASTGPGATGAGHSSTTPVNPAAARPAGSRGPAARPGTDRSSRPRPAAS